MKYNVSYSFKSDNLKELINKKILNLINTLEFNLNESEYDI